MRTLTLFFVLSFVFFSCKKSDAPFVSTGNYSGLLDSITTYVGDSSITNPTLSHGVIKFSYDNLKRVDKIQIGINNYFFFYDGVSSDPSILIDSSVNPNQPNYATVIKHQISYNASGKKVKDTISAYYQRNLTDNSIFPFVPTIKVYKFDHQSTYIAIYFHSIIC